MACSVVGIILFSFCSWEIPNVRRCDDDYLTLHFVIIVIRRSYAPASVVVYFLGENVRAIKTDP